MLPCLFGVIAHLGFWSYVITTYDNTNSWCCGAQLWILMYADFPVSMVYVTGIAETLTRCSAIVGSLWWGFLFWAIYRAGRVLIRRRA